MTSTPDELASAARELALAALHEVTAPSTVGPAAGHTVEESGALSLRFENRLPGYPGWYWTVSVAQVEGEEPTVLEVELMPGDGALLAPDWVPWAERLADYRAHQAELAEQAAADSDAESTDAEGDDDDEELDDVDDLDASDFDEDGSPHLHGGDLDGVDIDELDDSDDDDDDSDDDESDDDESDDDDDADDDDADDDDGSDDDDEDEDSDDDE